MNFRLALILMTLPTFVGSLLIAEFVTGRAVALGRNPRLMAPTSQETCDEPGDRPLEPATLGHWSHPISQPIMVASAATLPGEPATFKFSEAESDAAAVLFGCDCPRCIQALRQIQSQFQLNGGNGHCWTALQRRVSPQMVQEVLQDLQRKEGGPAR